MEDYPLAALRTTLLVLLAASAWAFVVAADFGAVSLHCLGVSVTAAVVAVMMVMGVLGRLGLLQSVTHERNSSPQPVNFFPGRDGHLSCSALLTIWTTIQFDNELTSVRCS